MSAIDTVVGLSSVALHFGALRCQVWIVGVMGGADLVDEICKRLIIGNFCTPSMRKMHTGSTSIWRFDTRIVEVKYC